jgi:hypothetical protein
MAGSGTNSITHGNQPRCYSPQEILAAALSPSSRISYRQALKQVYTFIASTLSGDYFPTKPETLVQYITFAFNKGLAPSTITSHLSAVTFIHKLSNQPDPAQAFVVRKMICGIHKLGHQPDIRLPLSLSHVCNLVASINHVASSGYMCVMFKAMYSLAFHALLRVGEFTGTNCQISNLLQLDHLVFLESPRLLQVTFHNFKHSTGHPPFSLTLSPQPNKSCPITNMAAYIHLRGQEKGPLFCFPGGQPVSRAIFTTMFNKSLSWIGLDPSRYKGHSFRIGKATALALANVPDHMIQTMGRWHSSAFRRYIRIQT